MTTKPILPRDSAGSFKIPATKPGKIKIMCSLPNHLEVYTPAETFKVQTPDAIDPGKTNPNAMWVNAKTHDVGSSSPFVARTVIMASEMLKSRVHPKEEAKRNALLAGMHSIKERLLECDAARFGIQREIDAALAEIHANGLRLAAGGRSHERFPVIPELESKATIFLIAARRCVTELCQIPQSFWNLSRPHSSLDHLLNIELIPILGDQHRLVLYLQGMAEGVRGIVASRNAQEHAATTAGQRLNLRNFELMPTNQIRPPCMFLDGDEPEDLSAYFQALLDFLLKLAEGMFIGCIDSTLPEWPPLFIRQMEAPDPECPIRYELSIDASGFPFVAKGKS